MAANLLEYTISLQDLVSAKLGKITVANDMMLDKWAAVEQKSVAVSSAFRQMGTSVYTLQQKVDLLKAERDLLPIGSLAAIRKYNSEITKLEGKITKLQTLNGSKVKTWFKDALNGLPGIATNPLVLLGAGIGKAVKMGMEADMQKANILTLVGGNAEKAKNLYKDLSDYGIKTPYEKADIIEAQKTMMSFGIDTETAFGKVKNIGDIALGDAQKMQSLSLAYAQASSAGKLQGQDLLQMINAGFNPLNEISKKTGESMASLKDRMSKGGVSAKELAKAFEWATEKGGTFYQGAEKASQTMGEMVSVTSKLMGNDATAAAEVLTTAMNQYNISLDDPMAASGKMAEMMNPVNLGAYRNRYLMGATYLDLLKRHSDPRLFIVADPAPKLYKAFKNCPTGDNNCRDVYDRKKDGTLTGASLFVGAKTGEPQGSMQSGSDSGEYSYPSLERYYSSSGKPYQIFSYAEQAFNIAEAANRGGHHPGAETHYKNAVVASMMFYGISETEAKAYYTTAIPYAGDNAAGLEQILTQKYIAFFNNSGREAYFNYRRTGYRPLT